jgi:hypothetical protein
MRARPFWRAYSARAANAFATDAARAFAADAHASFATFGFHAPGVWRCFGVRAPDVD